MILDLVPKCIFNADIHEDAWKIPDGNEMLLYSFFQFEFKMLFLYLKNCVIHITDL